MQLELHRYYQGVTITQMIVKNKKLIRLSLALAVVLLLLGGVNMSNPSYVRAAEDCSVYGSNVRQAEQCEERNRQEIANGEIEECSIQKQGTVSAVEACERRNQAIIQARENGDTINSSGTGNLEADCKAESLNKNNCGIIAYLVLLINVLSAIAGIVIVSMVVYGGIQYSVARDNPQAVQVAKSHITNAIMALVIFLFFYAFLNFIVPGGVF